MSFFYDIATGKSLGYFSDDSMAPAGSVAAPSGPTDGRQIWNAETMSWDDPPPILLPLTARQIRLALNSAGYLAATETAIAAGNEKNKIEWQYASEYRRDHELIAALAVSLGLTTEMVDAMWINAMSL